MKKLLTLSLLLGFLMAMTSPAWSATYYVDAVGGNDANDGQSPATAFATITKALNKFDVSVIEVASGDYMESIGISSGVSIIGPVDNSARIIVNSAVNPVVQGFGKEELSNLINITLWQKDETGVIGKIMTTDQDYILGANIVFTDCKFYVGVEEINAIPVGAIDTPDMMLTTCDELEAYIYDGSFYGATPIYPTWDGVEEEWVWENAWGPGKFFWNTPDCAPEGDLVYWLDPTGIPFALDTKISLWPDNTSIPEDATMWDGKRQPELNSTGFKFHEDGQETLYAEGFPAVKFKNHYGDHYFGYSDIMTSPNDHADHYEILPDNPDKFNPQAVDKSIFTVFQLSNKIDNPGDPDPYYSDGRQVIFEIGGPHSGANVGLIEGKLFFGMWNRFEEKYIIYNPPPAVDPQLPALYPLTQDAIYLAHMEYDGDNNKFRAILSEINFEGPTDYAVTSSPYVDFYGFSRDTTYVYKGDYTQYDDKTGVGGAARTGYWDYGIGATHSDHFHGNVGDVMIWNVASSEEDGAVGSYNPQNVYDFFNNRYSYFRYYANPPIDQNNYLANLYGFIYLPPVLAPPSPKNSDWEVIEVFNRTSENAISECYPNPFTTTTSFGVNIVEAQNVSVDLYDVMGNKVQNIYTGILSVDQHEFTINGTNLNSGVYLVKIQGPTFNETVRVVLNK